MSHGKYKKIVGGIIQQNPFHFASGYALFIRTRIIYIVHTSLIIILIETKIPKQKHKCHLDCGHALA